MGVEAERAKQFCLQGLKTKPANCQMSLLKIYSESLKFVRNKNTEKKRKKGFSIFFAPQLTTDTPLTVIDVVIFVVAV